MARLILGILVILLINVEVNALFPFSIGDIGSLIEWGRNLFMVASEIHSWSDSDVDRSIEENVVKILNEVKKVSFQLTSVASNIDQKLDRMSFMFMKNSRNNILQSQKLSLKNLINTVDRSYDKTTELKMDEKYSNETLRNFVHRVLWDFNNIPDVLLQISQIIIQNDEYIVSSYLQLMIQDAQENVQYDCNKYISAQQRLYYILVQIILAEMKGLYVITHVYTIQKVNDRSSNYTTELQNAKDKFRKRIEDYYKYITKTMELLPRDVHRCDVDPSKRGIDFFELYQFSRAIPFNIFNFTNSLHWRQPLFGFCQYECHNFYDIGMTHYTQTTGKKLYDCKKIGDTVEVCRAPKDSHREYMWWKNEEGTHGHATDCDDKVDISSFYDPTFSLLRERLQNWCETCLCSTDIVDPTRVNPHEKSVSLINMEPQVSDIENNMVVTGVQFIIKENAVHIQIQQNKFSSGGIPINESSWIDPVMPNPTTNKLSQRLKWDSLIHKYSTITDGQKTLFLDDLYLPEPYVVTGLGFFKKHGRSGFDLQILGTPFDFNTGFLNVNQSLWFFNRGVYKSEYEESKRVKIDMNEPDDPTRCQIYNYDQGTHKSIKFMHTDVRKDAGQNTVPFFDAQPVVTQPAFPLSGVGLFHRGRDGFGGYIAPRIFTIKVHKHFKMVLNNVTNTSFNQKRN